MRWTRTCSNSWRRAPISKRAVQRAHCAGCTQYCFDWLRTTPSRSSTRTVPTQHCRRLASLAAKLVKQLTYILYNMCDSTGSGATHLPATIASLSAHPQRILITLLVVQVIEIEWLVSRLQRWEQLPFAGVMMCSMPCVGVK